MRNKYILGALLVVVGIAMIFGKLGNFDMSGLINLSWPMIILMISGFFFLGYSSKRPYGAGLLVPAGILFTVGITFLLGNILHFTIWPAFIAAPAVGLLLLYIFGEKSSGLLVPIGTLLTIASVCFISQLFGIWGVDIWGITWPGFILAPAVGLFLLYLTGKQNSGLLIPIFILTAVAVAMFSVFSIGGIAQIAKYLFGGILILGGLSAILKKPARKDSYHHDDYT